MRETPINIQNITTIENMWENTENINGKLYKLFLDEVLNTQYLLSHRRYVEANKLGFGDMAFHYMWKVLLDDVTNKFNTVRFMEIGVFKGQVLSLVPMICEHENHPCEFLGVSPLSNAGDKFSKYPDDDYESIVAGMCKKFGVNFDMYENIIKGYSTDPVVIDKIKQHSFNLVYIDGSHNYADVVSDINVVDSVLEVGGYVVFDDASKFLNMPKEIWRGHIDVSKAVKDVTECNASYKEVFACGHNRVFRKIC